MLWRLRGDATLEKETHAWRKERKTAAKAAGIENEEQRRSDVKSARKRELEKLRTAANGWRFGQSKPVVQSTVVGGVQFGKTTGHPR